MRGRGGEGEILTGGLFGPRWSRRISECQLPERGESFFTLLCHFSVQNSLILVGSLALVPDLPRTLDRLRVLGGSDGRFG